MARVSKRDVWFKHFINEGCSSTFLNSKESAKKAGYKASSDHGFRSIGNENLTKLSDKITKWLDESGLSESALKIKLLSLMEAKETKFFQKDGIVTDERNVDAIETQRRTLDMALKIRGLYAPELHDHSGTLTIELVNFCDDGEG